MLKLAGISIVLVIVFLVQAPSGYAAKPTKVTFQQSAIPSNTLVDEVIQGKTVLRVYQVDGDATELVELTGDVSGKVIGGEFAIYAVVVGENELKSEMVTGEYIVSEVVIGGSGFEGELSLQFRYSVIGSFSDPAHFSAKGTWKIEGISGDLEGVTGQGTRYWEFGTPIAYSGLLRM